MSQSNPGNGQRDNEGQVVTAPNQPGPAEVQPPRIPIHPAEEGVPLETWPEEEDKPLWEPDPGE